MIRRTAFFSDELCFWHSAGMHALFLPVGGWVQPPAAAGFAESPDSKRRLKNLMDVAGLSSKLLNKSAAAASEEDLLRVHTPDYLKRFKEVSDAGGGELGPQAPAGPGSYEIAKKSAGLAMAAVDAVLSGEVDNAYSLSRPPGHHCLADQAMGFCFLANIPVAIEAAKAKYGLQRCAVVDWDVHHGNGTQSIYESSSSVLTISLHQDRCYPPGYSGVDDRGVGDGEGFNVNIPLPAGSGHEAYLQAMDEIVIPALEAFKPELIIVASGFDASSVDPLARMMLHSESYRLMTQRIRETAEKLCDGRFVVVHEGGYSEAYVPFCGVATIEEMVGVKTGVEDPVLGFFQEQQPGAEHSRFLRDYITQLAEQLGIKRHPA